MAVTFLTSGHTNPDIITIDVTSPIPNGWLHLLWFVVINIFSKMSPKSFKLQLGSNMQPLGLLPFDCVW